MTSNTNPAIRDLTTELGQCISLEARPGTDIYASPRHGRPLDGPMLVRTIPTTSFRSAKVTVELNWELQYDQGGLILLLPRRDPDNPNTGLYDAKTLRWIKAGIEVEDGKPKIGVVTCETWADWSLRDIPSPQASGMHKAKATIEFERHENALFVYLCHEGDSREIVREAQWVFMDDSLRTESVACGVYAARPDPSGEAEGRTLKVRFDDFAIATHDT